MRFAPGVCLAVALATACGTGADDENRVRVTVYHAGALAPGATVWFSDPDTGDVLAAGTTGSDGEFSAAVPAGASATAAVEDPDPDNPAWTLHSILGVEPGDQLWVGDRRSIDLLVLGTLRVRLPGAWPGAEYYSVAIGCTTIDQVDAQSPVSVQVTGDCLSASGSVVVRASAIDRAVPQALAFTPAVEVAPPSDETVTVELEPWQADGGELALTLTNVEAEPDAILVELMVSHDGLRFDRWEREVDPAGVEPILVPYQPGVGLQLSWRASIVYGSLAEGAQVLALMRSARAPVPGSAAVDFADALPRVSAVQGAIGAHGSPEVTWIVAADPAGADGLIVRAKWDNPNRTRLRWTLLAPATSTASVRFPALPDSLAIARGVPALPVEPTATLLDLDGAAGYRDFRLGGALDHLYQSPLQPGDDHRLSASGSPFF